jgi:hypothetical protein
VPRHLASAGPVHSDTCLGRRKIEYPHEILDASLGKPAQEILRVPPYHSVRILPRPARIPRGGVALVQVDGTLPNFALMQLSRHLKAQGHRVGLSVGGAHQVQNPAAVYASCVFTGAPSAKRAESLRERFGERLVLGVRAWI